MRNGHAEHGYSVARGSTNVHLVVGPLSISDYGILGLESDALPPSQEQYADLSQLRLCYLVAQGTLFVASATPIAFRKLDLREEHRESLRSIGDVFHGECSKPRMTALRSDEQNGLSKPSALLQSLEQVQLRQFENHCKLMCSEYFAANLPPNRYFKRRKIGNGIHGVRLVKRHV